MTYLRMYLSILGLILVLTLLAYLYCAGCRAYMLGESNPIENLTASGFFFSSVLAVIMLGRSRRNRGLLIFVAAAGALCVLEELSYGEHIFGFQAPVFRGVQLDSIHDSLFLAYRILRHHPVFVLVATVSFALPVIFLWARYRGVVNRKLADLLRSPPWMFVVITVVLGVVATCIDLAVLISPVVRRYVFVVEVFEEVLELGAALALAMSVISAATEGSVKNARVSV